jgi:pimeloyl-ACP methyl ester carboxylesterase
METYLDIPGCERREIDLGSGTVSYQIVGTGPNMLFVHGWPLNGNTWRNVVPHLQGYTRYVIDLPGTGQSKVATSTPLNVSGFADTIVALLDQLDLDDVTLVGQDSGGMVCRFAAEQRPDRIRALALCGTEIPGVHAPLVRLFKLLSKMPGASALFKMNMSNRFLARSPLILGGTVYDESLLDGEMRTNLLDPILADKDAVAALTKVIRGFSLDDIDALEDVHPNLSMPVLLVWGEDDPFFPVEKARAMVEQFAGPTDFVAIPKGKLFVHEEHPEQLAGLIADFLRATVSPNA